MATRNLTFGSGGKNEIDLIDVAALMLLPMAASFLFEVFTLEVNVFGSYDLTAPLWTLGGVDLSVTLLVSVAAIAWIAVTNFANSNTEWSQEEQIGIGVALALPVLFVFVPAVENLIFWNDLMQIAAVLWVSAASVYVSYVG